MASLAARAARNQEARERLNRAMQAIAKRLDIPIPERARRMKDAGLQPIVEIERFADFAENIEAALGDLAGGGEPPAGYDSWTVAMLREEINRRGLDAPSRAKKAALVAILEAADAAGTPDDGEEGDPESESEEDEDESEPEPEPDEGE